MTDLTQSKTLTPVIVDIEFEVTSHYIQCDIVRLYPGFDEPSIKRMNIRHELLNSWLSDKGYLDWQTNGSDHNGMHVQDNGQYGYVDYVDQIITPEIIHEYLFDTGRVSMAFDKSQL